MMTLRSSATLSYGQAILDAHWNLDPDVILMDLNMPDMGGLTATESLLELRPDTRIVMLVDA